MTIPLGSDERENANQHGGYQPNTGPGGSCPPVREALGTGLAAVQLRALLFRGEDKNHGRWIIYRELAA